MSQATTEDLLFSTLGADPDLGEIVSMFAEEMPDRVKAIQEAQSQEDWELLGRLAHQLKGASGSYGFHQITPVAAKLEEVVRLSAGEEAIQEAVEAVADICTRIRPGAPS